MANGRVVLAMSGGVDSSVSAHLLVNQGYEVIGLFMRTGATADHDDGDSCATRTTPSKIRGCCSARDATDAQRIADRLDIPFYALNFKGEFDRIKDYFVAEYSVGRTPNPCAVCNTWLKFGKLWDYARTVQADFIATGHYAQVVRPDAEHAAGTADVNAVAESSADNLRPTAELHRSLDTSKDQTYFLFGMQYATLARTLFPVGDLPKTRVRELAAEFGLDVHNKPDSQEICFVPSGDYQQFIREYRPESVGKPGAIVDPDGKVLGEHQGLARFTIGQRKGLGIAFGEPRYVVQIQPEENRVVVGPRELLEQTQLRAERVNWLLPQPPTGPIHCTVKIRYLHEPAAATVTPDADDPTQATVTFAEPQSAITPGQATVFYAGSHCLGGGWIAR